MIDFLKYTKLYLLLSAVVIIVGLSFLLIYGPNLSIDFSGGAVLVYDVQKSLPQTQLVTALRKQGVSAISITREKETVYLIKTKLIDEKKEAQLRSNLEKSLQTNIKQLRYETVGPILGVEMMQKTLIASFIALVGILAYLTFAFKRLNYGVAAVVAMLHDLLVLIGVYSLLSHFFGAEIDTLFVTAVLTTLSFSVHDTIVLFDKIREYRKHSALPLVEMANKAFTETVVRSVNNSLTILLMLVPLTLFGGTSIRFFAAALLIGTVTGMYSSPFIAVPVLVWLEKRK